VFLLSILSDTPAVQAQVVTGTLLGTVRDPNGPARPDMPSKNRYILQRIRLE
jgi:hypothetical protein